MTTCIGRYLRQVLLPRSTETTLSEGALARLRAEEELRQARAQTPRYEALGHALRDQYERNHLQEALSSLFRGDDPSS